MARLSLQTAEIARLLEPRAGTPAAARELLAKLAPGQIVRAQVIRSLGDGLFSVNIRGAELVTASSTPLTPGQFLTLQANTTGQGQTAFHVVTLVDDTVAATAARPDATELEHQQLPDQVTARRLLAELIPPSRSPGDLAVANRPPADTPRDAARRPVEPRLVELLDPRGPLARLIAQRPELAGRIENLLAQFAQKGDGIGPGMARLIEQIESVLSNSAPARQSRLVESKTQLFEQLLGKGLLERPEELARVLGDKLAQLARGLEGNLVKLPAAAPSGAPVEPTPILNPRTVVAASPAVKPESAATAGADPSATSPKAELIHQRKPAAAASSSTSGDKSAARPDTDSAAKIVQGAFDGDLKGQLLQLRAQLQSVQARAGDPATAVRNAIGKVDQLLDQVTARQIHNLEGLNRYLHVELPMDPRTGIHDARLEVFYRNPSESGREPDRFTVAMFLNLSRLGDVLAVLTEIDKFVTVGFTVEDESAMTLLESNGDLLRSALTRSGHAGASVIVRRATPKPDKSADVVWGEFLDLVPQSRDAGGRLDQKA